MKDSNNQTIKRGQKVVWWHDNNCQFAEIKFIGRSWQVTCFDYRSHSSRPFYVDSSFKTKKSAILFLHGLGYTYVVAQ